MSTTDEKGHDSDPLIGQNIAENRYKIVRIIGEGGMGKVYLGEQKLGDRVRPVAIKTLQPDLAGDPQIVARFHREAGTVSLLDHPNTIKFYESGELPGGKLFVAMEFIQGESLAHSIARGPLAPQRIEHILQQVCGSLAEAHEHGIVHRDLKPENIILTQKGSKGDFVKVLDFGIAKRDESSDAQDAKLTRQGMVLGTPPYMSPEQFTAQPLRATSDVYSLGIVVYEMLTGQLPFVASTPWEWATKHLTAAPVPFEMHSNGATILPRHKAAVMRALAKDQAQRPQTVIDFLKEFTGDTGAGADWAVSTNQGHSSGPQGQQIPPTAMVPQHPSNPGSHPGMPGVAQTMAVNYPTPTPFNPSSNPNFMQPSNQGFTPAPSNAGFNPVQPPPSNPGFQPGSGQGYNPYGSQPGGYNSQPGGYNSQPGQRPSGGGSGKIIAGVVALVVIVGGVTAFAIGGRDDPPPAPAPNTNTAIANTPTTPVGVQTPVVPVQNQVPTNGIQPIPSPINNPSIQAVPAPNNGNDIQPMPPPNNPSILPVAPPPTTPDPPRPVVRRPSSPCGRESNIDDLIINGRCSQAQALFRTLRSAGCRVSASDHFGTACAAP